jgi:hypothetical protein
MPSFLPFYLSGGVGEKREGRRRGKKKSKGKKLTLFDSCCRCSCRTLSSFSVFFSMSFATERVFLLQMLQLIYMSYSRLQVPPGRRRRALGCFFSPRESLPPKLLLSFQSLSSLFELLLLLLPPLSKHPQRVRLGVEHELVQIEHGILGEEQEEIFKSLGKQPGGLRIVLCRGRDGDVPDPGKTTTGDFRVLLESSKSFPAVEAPFGVLGGPPEVEEGLDGLAV